MAVQEVKVKLSVENESEAAFEAARKTAKKYADSLLIVNGNAIQVAQKSARTAKEISALEVQYKNADAAATGLNTTLNDQVGLFDEIVGTLSGFISTVSDTVAIVSNLINVIERLADPALIGRMAKLANVMGGLMLLKGQGDLAKGFFAASDALGDVAVDMQKLGLDFEQRLNTMNQKVDTMRGLIEGLGMAFKGVVAAGAGFVSLGLVRAFQQLSPNVAQSTTLVERFGSVAERSFKSPQLLLKGLSAGFKQASSDVVFFTKNSSSMAGALTRSVAPGFLTMTEASIALGPILFALGRTFSSSENDALRFAGTLTSTLAVAMFGFSTAVTFLTAALGGLAAAIGDRLIDMMTRFEDKAIKAEQATQAFLFTIAGFTRVLGESVIGSLEGWNALITQIATNSTIAASELQKGAKLLIAEGAALKLGVEDNMALLSRASDIAASTGKDLVDVINRIVSGLAGQSQGLLALGINTSEAALAHSDLAHELGLTVEGMDEQQKIQLRMNEIFKQSAPVIGAAAAALDTVAGANAKYEQSISRLQTRLGEQSAFTVAYTNILTNLFNAFASLPDAIIDTTGASLDFLGVSLKIGGTLLKYAITLASIVTIYKILVPLVQRNIVLQGFLSSAFAFTGSAVGVQTAQVTSLSVAYSNLIMILRGALLTTLKSVGVALLTVTKRITLMGFAILKNPLFLKAALIATAVFAIVKAFQELQEELSFLNFSMTESSKEFTFFTDLVDKLKFALEGTVRAITALAKFMITGLIQTALFAARAFVVLQKAMTTSEMKARAFEMQIAEIDKRLRETNKVAMQAGVALITSFDETAIAAEKVEKEVAKANKKLELMAKRRKDLAEFAKGIDTASERTKVLGDEYDRLLIAIRESKAAQAEASEAYITGSKKAEDALKDFQSATLDLARNEASLELARKQIFTQFSDRLTQLKIEQLKASGDLRAAVALETEATLAAFDAQVERLEKVYKLTDDQRKLLKELRKELSKIRDEEKAMTIGDLFSGAIDFGKSIVSAFKSAKNALSNIDLGSMDFSFANMGKVLMDGADAMWNALKDGGRYIADQVSQIELQDVGSAIVGAFELGAEFLSKVINAGQYIDTFSRWVDTIANLPRILLETLSRLDHIISSAIEMIPQALVKLSEELPKIFEKIFANADKLIKVMHDAIEAVVKAILKILPKLVRVILDATIDIIKRLPEFFDDLLTAVEGIFDAIFDKLPDIIDAIFEALPDIIVRIVQAIVNIVEDLMDNVDDIIAAFIEGIIVAATDLAIKFTDYFVFGGGAERLIGSILRMIPRLVGAIVSGLWKGLSRAVDMIFKRLSGKKIKLPDSIEKLPEKLIEGVDRMGKAIAKESSQLFQVKDLEDSFGGLDPSQSITDAVDNVITKLGKTMRGMWDSLAGLWDNIMNHIWKPMMKVFEKIWSWVSEMIVKPLTEAFQMVWEYAYEYIVGPLVNGLRQIWDWVYKYVVQGMVNMVRRAWATILNFFQNLFKGQVEKAFSGVFSELKSIGPDIWNSLKSAIKSGMSIFSDMGGNIWNGLKSGLNALPNFFKNMFDKLNPGNLFEKIFKVDYKGKGTVEKALNINVPFAKFAQGGIVPGNAQVPGDSFMNDRVLALVSPGEAVIPRSITQDPRLAPFVKSLLDGSFARALPLFGGSVSIGGSGGVSIGTGGVSVGGVNPADPAGVLEKGEEAIKELAKLNPAELWKTVKAQFFDNYMKIFEYNKFHDGGFVGSFAMGGEVPATLLPGEFVVNRQATRKNFGFLNAINEGASPGGISIGNVTINASTNLTPESIRREVVPTLMDEIKRKSQNGRYVLDAKGVR